MENFATYVELALAVLGLFAIIATITPNEADNKIVQAIYTIVNKLGLNVGRSRNE